MAMHLPVADDGTSLHPQVWLQWLAQAQQSADGHALALALPRDGAGLPDLLALSASQMFTSAHPLIRTHGEIIWEGPSGGHIRLRHHEGASVAHDRARAVPLHTGQLPGPCDFGTLDPAVLYGLTQVARIDDAAAVIGGGAPVDWDRLLTAIAADTGSGSIPSRTVTRCAVAHPALTSTATWGAWNPLPFARRAVIALPAGANAPWTVIDSAGMRHPVQISEGIHGREAIISLALGALAATPLTPCDVDAPGGHWEVSPAVIDNGRLRAEFDLRGRIVRLCIDGVFAEQFGPLVVPLSNGIEVEGSCAITVIEDGPVRARVGVAITSADGRLDLLYTLHEHDTCLRIQATWSGDPDRAPVLNHAGLRRHGDLLGAGLLSRRRVVQSARLDQPMMEPEPGWRWAHIDDRAGRSPLIASDAPLVISAHAGAIAVWIDGPTRFALSLPAAHPTPGLLAESLACGHRPYAGPPRPALLRWSDLGGVVPRWIRRHDDRIELLVSESNDAPARAWCFPDRSWASALPNAVRRSPRFPAGIAAPLSRERDAWRIDALPNELVLITWSPS